MDKKILLKFGKRVREERLLRGWSQEELGKRSGLHRTYIGSIERHERNISLINVQSIARAFKISISSLVD